MRSWIFFSYTITVFFQTLDFIFCGVDYEHLTRLGIEPIQCLSSPPKLEDVLAEQTEGALVTIFQHAQGWAKTYSTHKLLSINRPFFKYIADTLPGSSGGPVFMHVSGQNAMALVGIHKAGNQQDGYNTGILLEEIISFISTDQCE